MRRLVALSIFFGLPFLVWSSSPIEDSVTSADVQQSLADGLSVEYVHVAPPPPRKITLAGSVREVAAHDFEAQQPQPTKTPASRRRAGRRGPGRRRSPKRRRRNRPPGTSPPGGRRRSPKRRRRIPPGTSPPGKPFLTVDWKIPVYPKTYTVPVGKWVRFKWAGYHNVAQSTRSRFAKCSKIGNEVIGAPAVGGNAMVKIERPGMTYYICEVGSHCSMGQKITIKGVPATGATRRRRRKKSPPTTTTGPGTTTMPPTTTKPWGTTNPPTSTKPWSTTTTTTTPRTNRRRRRRSKAPTTETTTSTMMMTTPPRPSPEPTTKPRPPDETTTKPWTTTNAMTTTTATTTTRTTRTTTTTTTRTTTTTTTTETERQPRQTTTVTTTAPGPTTTVSTTTTTFTTTTWMYPPDVAIASTCWLKDLNTNKTLYRFVSGGLVMAGPNRMCVCRKTACMNPLTGNCMPLNGYTRDANGMCRCPALQQPWKICMRGNGNCQRYRGTSYMIDDHGFCYMDPKLYCAHMTKITFGNVSTRVALGWIRVPQRGYNFSEPWSNMCRCSAKDGYCQRRPSSTYAPMQCLLTYPKSRTSPWDTTTVVNGTTVNGTCSCRRESECMSDVGSCRSRGNIFDRDEAGWCICKNSTDFCTARIPGEKVKLGQQNRCIYKPLSSRQYNRNPDGTCACKTGYCWMNAACTPLGSRYKLGDDGQCVPGPSMCLMRFREPFHSYPTLFTGVSKFGKYVQASDGVSCACNKDLGYCFSREVNDCVTFKWTVSSNGGTHPSTQRLIWINGARVTGWFGQGRNNVCKALTHPFTGKGCRTWREGRRCSKMLALGHIEAGRGKDFVKNCLELADADKRCYKTAEGGKIIIIPQSRPAHTNCFCSTQSCIDGSPDVRPGRFTTFACGLGHPRTTTTTTSTTIYRTTTWTTTTTVTTLFNESRHDDVPPPPPTCTVLNQGTGKLVTFIAVGLTRADEAGRCVCADKTCMQPVTGTCVKMTSGARILYTKRGDGTCGCPPPQRGYENCMNGLGSCVLFRGSTYITDEDGYCGRDSAWCGQRMQSMLGDKVKWVATYHQRVGNTMYADPQTGACKCKAATDRCELQSSQEMKNRIVSCVSATERNPFKNVNGSCACRDESACKIANGHCHRPSSSSRHEKGANGYCVCKNDPSVCRDPRKALPGDYSVCRATSRQRIPRDSHGRCGCPTNYCLVTSGPMVNRCVYASRGTYVRGADGLCWRPEGWCLKRWLLQNKDGTKELHARHGDAEKYQLGSDGVSCICNKALGFCFSKHNNMCEQFKWNIRQYSVYPRAKPAWVNGSLVDVWFGTGENNFCVAAEHPFTGEGCRLWDQHRTCRRKLSLHHLSGHVMNVDACHKLAMADDRCYTTPGGGKIVIMPSRAGHPTCYCSVNACLKNKHRHSDSSYNLFACGAGFPKEHNMTTTTTTPWTSWTTTTTTAPVVCNRTASSYPCDVPVVELCSMTNPTTGKVVKHRVDGFNLLGTNGTCSCSKNACMNLVLGKCERQSSQITRGEDGICRCKNPSAQRHACMTGHGKCHAFPLTAAFEVDEEGFCAVSRRLACADGLVALFSKSKSVVATSFQWLRGQTKYVTCKKTGLCRCNSAAGYCKRQDLRKDPAWHRDHCDKAPPPPTPPPLNGSNTTLPPTPPPRSIYFNVNGTCKCAKQPTCRNQGGDCPSTSSARLPYEKGAGGLCSCKNSTAICVRQKQGAIPGDISLCMRVTGVVRRSTNGTCECLAPRYCRKEDGSCAATRAGVFKRGDAGQCEIDIRKNYCLRRWYHGQQHQLPVGRQYAFASDGTSCKCNKALGWCFLGLLNGCVQYKVASRGSSPPTMTGHVRLPLGPRGEYKYMFLGSGAHNFCTVSSDPFTGDGCRMWKDAHKCHSMIGLPAVPAQGNYVDACYAEAMKEKRCYSSPGGGKTIILPRINRPSTKMLPCFCGADACLGQKSTGHFRTFACGSGMGTTTTSTTTTTTTTTTTVTFTTTAFDSSDHPDVPVAPTCWLKRSDGKNLKFLTVGYTTADKEGKCSCADHSCLNLATGKCEELFQGTHFRRNRDGTCGCSRVRPPYHVCMDGSGKCTRFNRNSHHRFRIDKDGFCSVHKGRHCAAALVPTFTKTPKAKGIKNESPTSYVGDEKTGLCGCPTDKQNYCKWGDYRKDDDWPVVCIRSRAVPVWPPPNSRRRFSFPTYYNANGTCGCGRDNTCKTWGSATSPSCRYMNRDIGKDADGWCMCPRDANHCTLRIKDTFKGHITGVCANLRSYAYRNYYVRAADGFCECNKFSCRMESTGRCMSLAQARQTGHTRGPSGLCVFDQKATNWCLPRWHLEGSPGFGRGVRAGSNLQHVVASDGVSCACNKKLGYCFDKGSNKCALYKMDPNTPRRLPPGSVQTMIDGEYGVQMADGWLGSDKNNMCKAYPHPFTGEGCRTWRTQSKCKNLLGLHAVEMPVIGNCAKLAEKNKECYTGKGHGKIVVIPYDAFSGRTAVHMCFCAKDACTEYDSIVPDTKYNTFVCGK